MGFLASLAVAVLIIAAAFLIFVVGLKLIEDKSKPKD